MAVYRDLSDNSVSTDGSIVYPKFREILCCSRFRHKLQCLQPSRIGLDKKSPSYILLLFFHHETILLRVLKDSDKYRYAKGKEFSNIIVFIL